MSAVDEKKVETKATENQRGIPVAVFIEDLSAEVKRGGGADEVLKTLHNLYG